MLIILFNWIYIALTAFALGQAFACFVEKHLHYHIKRMDSVLVAGLVAATIYAQIFSLFYKVGFVANIVLLVFCLLSCFLLRKRMAEQIRRCLAEYSAGRKIMVLLLILIWAYFTSRGYLVYDSDLYHGQSIRWIEEYGVVKGLGNLHVRFAYNSSSFALSALYSMKFLLGRSLHTVSGFFALILSITTLDIAASWKRKKLLLSDYARAAAIYYLTTICNEVVSPSSDYVVMCVIFFIIIKWLTILETEKECRNIAPYALLCVCGVYAVTLKLTAGLILILLIKPAYMLIKGKRGKEICIYLLLGLLVGAPWLIRTVIISGWLLYPYPQLDLFSFDWKIKTERVMADAAEIRTWGRGLYDASKANLPITQWFPNWFRQTLSTTEKLLIMADIICIGIFILTACITVFKRKWKNPDYFLMQMAVICSYLFWQFSAPLLRYGYAYVLLLTALTAGWLLREIKVGKIVYFLLLFYGGYKLCMLSGYVIQTANVPNYIWQSDYGTYELQSFKIADETFYIPTTGDRTGYAYFPSIPLKVDVEFRGDSIKDGFRACP